MNAAAPAPPAPADAAPPEDGRRAMRRRIAAMISGSYALDALMLALFAAAGTVPAGAAAAYGAAGIGTTLLFLALQSRGGSAADPYLTLPQMVVNTALLIGFVHALPQVGAPMLMVLFIVFAFGALRMSPRRSVAAFGATVVPVTALLALTSSPIAWPQGGAAERLIAAAWFATVLARSLGLGLLGSGLRRALAMRNAQLADTSAQLRTLAERDDLTGALNRRSVMQWLHEQQAALDAGGPAFAVALFDLDHFKQVNDRCGHAAGDEVLRRFVRVVAAEARSVDRIGRLGGEEFVLLLPQTGSADAAREAAERMRLAVAGARWQSVAPGLCVTASVGVAVARAGQGVEPLLANADAALYRAKEAGRNLVCEGEALV